MAPAWYCPYKRKAFLNINFSFVCNNSPPHSKQQLPYGPLEVAQTCSTFSNHQRLTHTDTVVLRQVWPPLTFDPASLIGPSCRVTFLPCLSHAERWIPKQPGAGAGSAQKMKHWKLVGGKECKGVKRKKRWPILAAVLRFSSDGVFKLAMGRRRLCCTCTCSRGRWEWPEGGRGRQPAGAGRTRQRSPQPAFCAR